MLLDGKVAIITGSARNIGKECALLMAQEGAKVIVNARTKDRVDQVIDEITAAGGQATPSYNSVDSKEGCEALVADAVKAYGTVDILVNNAAIVTFHAIHEMPDEDWVNVVNTDLTAYFRMTKAVLPFMIEKEWGRIVNMSSHAGLTGTTLRSHYAASKGGIQAFTKATAKEYGKYNITANAIAPFVAGEKQASSPNYGAMYVPAPAEFDAQNTAISTAGMAIPGRATSKEVAPMVAFFASQDAWYITGQVISVGGGRWMG